MSQLSRIVMGYYDHLHVALVLDMLGCVQSVHARLADETIPWVGDIYQARVQRYAVAQRAFHVDLGHGRLGFLPHPLVQAFAAGDMLSVTVQRPATKEKAARLALADTDNIATKLGCIQKGPSLIDEAQKHFPHATVEAKQDIFDGYAHWLADLTQPFVKVQEGLSMMIEETAALTAIDVNNANPKLDGLAANVAVIPVLLRQIALRNIGGQIVIDFLRLRNPGQQKKVTDLLAANAMDYGLEIYGWTRLGLFEVVRRRVGRAEGLSLQQLFAL